MSKRPTAEIAPSAAPPHAILVWCDLVSIFVQFPSIHGPCVLSYPRDTKGLSDVLKLMATRHATEGAGQPYYAPIRSVSRDPRFAPKQRDVVAELMRKKGIGR